MNAEEFYIANYRSKFNPCFKENRKIEQFTFDDMIEFAERYKNSPICKKCEGNCSNG
jgi:hypothetical protein